MLIVCRDCERQYDVGEMVPGSKFLCRCGLYVRVPEVEVRDAVVTRCPSCGAALDADANACGYCGSEISLLELSLGEACPKCLSRMFRGAKFCSTCGVRIETEKLSAADLGDCPRCETPTLVVRPVEGGRIVECTTCNGIWLDEGFFDRIVEERDERAMGAFTNRRTGPEREPVNPDAKAVRYLACPVCGERMHRRNFGRSSGVVIDSCRDHGYWFDAFELERIFHFVKEGGLDRARRREIEEMRDELRRVEAKRSSVASSPIGDGSNFGLSSVEGLTARDLDDMLEDVVAGVGRLFRKLFGRR